MIDLKTNQNNQGWGGVRPNSGRKPGSSSKPKITDHMTPEEIKEMVQLFISQCREKSDLMKFLMEQIFGKATQGIEHSGTLNLTQLLDELDRPEIKEQGMEN